MRPAAVDRCCAKDAVAHMPPPRRFRGNQNRASTRRRRQCAPGALKRIHLNAENIWADAQLTCRVVGYNVADLLAGSTPDLVRLLLMTPSAESNSELTTWKSPEFPGWSLTLKTPDLAAIMGARRAVRHAGHAAQRR